MAKTTRAVRNLKSVRNIRGYPGGIAIQGNQIVWTLPTSAFLNIYAFTAYMVENGLLEFDVATLMRSSAA